MRRVALSILLMTIAVTAAAQNPPATGTIEGHIVRIGTSQGIADALVTLTSIAPTGLSPEAAARQTAEIESIRRNSNIQGGTRADGQASVVSFLDRNGLTPNTTVYVLSDSSGRFAFRNVPPGHYNVRAERDGFVAPRVNETYQTGFSRNISVEANTPSTMEMEFIPNGVLTGRVFDPMGRPAANVSVTAYRVIISAERNGGETWFAGRAVMTNDLGEYRLINVLPGGLWIGAAPRGAGEQASWQRTFYGDAVVPEEATRVRVIDGGEVKNLDIHLRARTSGSTIRGTAINPFAQPDPATGVSDRSVPAFQLVNRKVSVLNDGRPTYQNMIPVTERQNGEFEIRNISPGSYDLVATVTDRVSRQSLTGTVHVEVGSGDMSGVSLALSQGMTVNGDVDIRGSQAALIQPGSISIVLASLGPTNGAASMKPDAMGRFSSGRLPEDRYRVQVSGLPVSAYIADIKFGDRSIFDSGFDLNSTPGAIHVAVNSDGQTVSGTVQSKDGKPVGAATVVLVPPESQRQNPARFKQATTDDLGHYTMSGVAPGEYKIFAWENVYNNAWLNARYLAHFENQGRPITISASTSQPLQLEAIPTENYLEFWAR